MIILSAIFCFLIFAAVNIDITTSINRRVDRKLLDDVRFTPRQKQQMRMRLFWKFAEKWKDGVVPYTIEANFQNHTDRVKVIQDAIAVYASKTCIKWIPRTNEENYIKFIDDNACYSYVGCTRTGAQPLSIGEGCEQVGTVLHEMMHAVGFLHEQQRPDRDEYITVNVNVIQKDKLFNFDKMNYENVQLQSTKYDYDSVMHYPYYAFAIDGEATTIETKDKSKQFTIGQRVAFTACDLEKLNLMYQCKDKIKNDPKCVSNVPGVKTCYDSADCPTATSYMMCQRQPGKFNDICKSTCENCDGKQCFDTKNYTLRVTVCQNDKATCDDYKKSLCPKTCGTCKAEPKTCSDDPTCPINLSIRSCQNYPGIYLDKCKATCDNCDGKQCYDTLDEFTYRRICQNDKPCDDNKKIFCPKTCEICKPAVETTTKPSPPSTKKPSQMVLFPCLDASTSSCQQNLKKDKNYCEKGTANFAYARSSCCMTCAISKGFTVKQERKITKPNGEIITNYVTVVDLTGSAASSWAALPKVNTIYPGMNKIQTDAMCKERAGNYGTERFCADPYSRCVCGETCLSYNYPI